jgi:predicted helicase
VAKAVETGHDFAHVFVTSSLADHHCVSIKEVSYVLPLFVYPAPGGPAGGELRFAQDETGPQPNLSEEFWRAVDRAVGVGMSKGNCGRRAFTAEELFGFLYGILFSPSYRTRYASFLRKEFARIPIPCTRELLRRLAELGGELISLHLMESARLDVSATDYNGPPNPQVARVAWSNDTVWLDSPATSKGQAASSGTIGFGGVPEAVWNFHIGGYRVCEKWLKDRKGRKLSAADIEHYGKIVAALAESIRLMHEIDEVIEQYGGWPKAFEVGSA